MQAWFLLLFPIALGIYGFALMLNLFGATDDMATFYHHERANWFPILQGDSRGWHRFIGFVLAVFALAMGIAFWQMGIL